MARRHIIQVSTAAIFFIAIFLFSIKSSVLKPTILEWSSDEQHASSSPELLTLHQNREHFIINQRDSAISVQVNNRLGGTFQKITNSGDVIVIDLPPGISDSDLFLKIESGQTRKLLSEQLLPAGLTVADDLIVKLDIVPKTIIDIELNKKPILYKDLEITFVYKYPEANINLRNLSIYRYSNDLKRWEPIINQHITYTQNSIIISVKTGVLGTFALFGKPLDTPQLLQQRVKSLQEKVQGLLDQLRSLLKSQP